MALKAQFKLLFNRREFWIAFFIMFCISVAAFLGNCAAYFQNDLSNIPSAYSKFVLFEAGSFLTTFLPFLTCIILAVPFADSYMTDKQSRVLTPLFVRCGAKKYFYSKLVAVACSSALIVFIPSLVNLLLNFSAFPLNGICDPTNQMAAESQYHKIVTSRFLFDNIFYSNPYIYNLMFLFIYTAFIVLASLFVYKLSFFVSRSRVIVVFSFFIIYDVIAIINNLLPVLSGNENFFRIEPFSYITPGDTYMNKSPVVFAAIFLIFILINLFLSPLCIRRLEGDKK